MTVKGINTVTISQGKVVYQDGDIRTERGVGRYIDRPTHAPYYAAVQKRRDLEAPSAVDWM
jgi:dihydropyrimidinase